MYLITCQSKKKHIEIELNLILVSFYFHELAIFMKTEGYICVSVKFSYLSEEKHQSRQRIIGIFHFHLHFLKTIFKNIIYCQTVHVFGQFTYLLIYENVCQACLSFFLLLAIFCLDPCQMEIICSTQHLCHW